MKEKYHKWELKLRWERDKIWYLFPTLEFKLWGDELFTKRSWTLSILWLKIRLQGGFIELYG